MSVAAATPRYTGAIECAVAPRAVHKREAVSKGDRERDAFRPLMNPQCPAGGPHANGSCMIGCPQYMHLLKRDAMVR